MSGSIQLFCRRDVLGDEGWALLANPRPRATSWAPRARCCATRRGQLSVSPTSLTVLSKSLRPLAGEVPRPHRPRGPVTAKRYLDLIMNPEVRDVFRKRSQIVSLIRRFMEADGYMEVETPMMHAILGGANAKPFRDALQRARSRFLPCASPRSCRSSAASWAALSASLRSAATSATRGMDLTHNPEFTSMEAYCAYGDLSTMKRLSQDLFKMIAREVCGCAEGHEVITYQGPGDRHVRRVGQPPAVRHRLGSAWASTWTWTRPSSACVSSARPTASRCSPAGAPASCSLSSTTSWARRPSSTPRSCATIPEEVSPALQAQGRGPAPHRPL